MFGRGVISTQYAWAYEKAGHTVEFFVRPGKAAEYGSSVTLNIYDARKKIKGVLVNENWNIKLREDLDANHDYDLIILSVQHYSFEKAVDFLKDKIGNSTLLIFNNLWEEPQEAVAKLPGNQLVWGFPQAGGGFDSKGILNGTLFGTVNIGTFGYEQTQRGIAVIDLFKSAGFKIKEFKDFRSWLFSHFVLNAAIHLEVIKSGTGLSSPLQSTQFWRNVILNGKELLPLLQARNVDLKASSEVKVFSLPPWVLSLLIKVAFKFLPAVKQIFTGHSNHFELISYCQDVMSKAEEMKISLPRFEKNKNIYQSYTLAR